MDQANPQIGEIRLDHMSIMVPALGASLDWYQNMLGAELIDRWGEPEKGMEWAKLSLGNFKLELVQLPGFSDRPERTRGHHHIAIRVPDCEAFVAAFAKRGGEVMRGPSYFDRHDFHWAFIKDNCGNILEVISPASSSDAQP